MIGPICCTKVHNSHLGAFSAATLHLGGYSYPSVTFSPDGLLACDSEDATVRLWDTATGVLQQTLGGHSRCVTSVAFSPDDRLASGSHDAIVQF